MDETFVFVNQRDDGGTEVLVNFGMHAGREATQAEVERLGQELVRHTEVVDVVCEQRYRFDRERDRDRRSLGALESTRGARV